MSYSDAVVITALVNRLQDPSVCDDFIGGGRWYLGQFTGRFVQSSFSLKGQSFAGNNILLVRRDFQDMIEGGSRFVKATQQVE